MFETWQSVVNYVFFNIFNMELKVGNYDFVSCFYHKLTSESNALCVWQGNFYWNCSFIAII